MTLRLAVLCAVVATPLASQDTSVVVTRHTSRAAGRVLTYTAQAGRLPIRAMNAEEPRAYMFYVAYRIPATTGSPRPITFMWGGGPSSAGLGTHMEFGPRRVESTVADNDLTLLTVSDLVFIDPVGTGFSRPTKAEYGKEFYGVLGDQASFAEFIRAWRMKYDAANAPIFLWGVSYGTWRVSGVTELLERSGVRVAGAILNSGGIQMGPEAQPREFVVAHRTPGRAATAFAQKKLSADVGTTLDEVLRNSEKWAVEVYAPALARVAALTDEERESIAAQLSRHTGYPVDKIDRKTLSFSPRAFLNDGLLPGMVINNYDGRRATPAPQPGSGGSGGGGQGASPVNNARMKYLRTDLGYRTDLAYLSVERGYMPTPGPTFTGPGPWEYNSGQVTPAVMAAAQAGEGPPGTDAWIKRALAINPQLKVFVAAGMYDSLNSCSGNRDLIQREGVAANFTLKCYLAGHGIREPDAQPQFAADLRAFIQSTVGAR